jgi:hypothetical protein
MHGTGAVLPCFNFSFRNGIPVLQPCPFTHSRKGLLCATLAAKVSQERLPAASLSRGTGAAESPSQMGSHSTTPHRRKCCVPQPPWR